MQMPQVLSPGRAAGFFKSPGKVVGSVMVKGPVLYMFSLHISRRLPEIETWAHMCSQDFCHSFSSTRRDSRLTCHTDSKSTTTRARPSVSIVGHCCGDWRGKDSSVTVSAKGVSVGPVHHGRL